MDFEVVTLFPEMFEGFLRSSLVGRAVQGGLLRVSFTNPRDFTADRHRSVDDAPYGGGVGMIMKVEPVVAAIEAAIAARGAARRILLSPAGKALRQERIKELACLPRVLLVCGRYEGLDERIGELAIDEELSVGDYVLAGGEVAAMVVIEAVSRYVPGVLGEAASTEAESFSLGMLEYPQYTRPVEYRGLRVPDVLLSGNHRLIAEWRSQEALRRTRLRRPDLLNRQEQVDSSLAASQAAAATYLALLHYPVLERGGRVVATAITNLDVHDLARAARTFGLAGYFVVTPIGAQRELVGRIVAHWQDGAGREHNSNRAEALRTIRIVASLAEAIDAIATDKGAAPLVVATSARDRPGALTPAEVLSLPGFPSASPLLMVFGTGWGLSEEVLAMADAVLQPIEGCGNYNHLSVRAAVAIVLDRLFGNRDPGRKS
ncbi:MAG: tRNA (guanosine(37)-N1)-methyltransferase TrmD [Pseudomonadota bacterium]